MDTTAFSTPVWTRQAPEQPPRSPARWRIALRGLVAILLAVLLLGGRALHAAEPEILQATLQRSPEGLFLSARLGLKPSPAVEEALLKGVPLYFVWQAEVLRQRWYWTDRRLVTSTRTWRLAYQPLTRRWRLSLSNDTPQAAAGTGLQYALHQNFDSLTDALANVGRVSNWKLADAARLRDAQDEMVDWSFRLDLGLLPRPFQIGMANQPEWMIAVQRRLPVPAELSSPAAAAVPEAAADGGSAAR